VTTVHRLVASAGVQPRATTYALPGGGTVDARSSVVASIEALARAGAAADEVVVLATPEAWRDQAEWTEAMAGSQVRVCHCELDATHLNHPWSVADAFMSLDWSGVERVSLDVTHGPRAIPMALLAGALLLTSVAPTLEVEAVFVASQFTGHDPTPLHRADDLVELVRLGQAADATVGGGPAMLFRRPRRRASPGLKRLAGAVGSLADALAWANPGDVGAGVEKLRSLAVEPASAEERAMGGVVERLRQRVDAFGPGGTDPDEVLRAQLDLCEAYLGWRDLLRSALVLREWLVSRVLAARAVPVGQWGEKKGRDLAEEALGCVRNSPGEVGRLFSRVSERRNALAHGWFTRRSLDAELDKFRRDCCDAARATLAHLGQPDDPWRLDAPAGEHLLLTAVGVTMEVLEAAASQVGPDRVVAITSAELAPHSAR
jgi:CRISPR-associated (Cas) DxTHG family